MKISAFKEKIQESDIGKRMMSGAVWSFTGTALAKFIILIAGIFCAHILTKVQYGEFGMIRSTINMFIVFGYAGLGMTATKYISEYKSEHPEKISSIYLLTNGFAIVMGILVTLLVLVTAPFLAAKTLNSPYLTNDIRFGALLLFFTIINGAHFIYNISFVETPKFNYAAALSVFILVSVAILSAIQMKVGDKRD